MYMREREFCRCFSCDGILYQVRRGDTLYSISRRFQVALEDVMDANPFINVYRLEPGMQICVPVRETEEGNRGGREGAQRTWREDGGEPENGQRTWREDGGEPKKGQRTQRGNGERDTGTGMRINPESDEDFCPYGLCRDPMRFDGADW